MMDLSFKNFVTSEKPYLCTLNLHKNVRLKKIRYEKKYLSVKALLSAGLMACHNEPAFKVEGTVSGAADKMLYLEHTSLEGIVKVDSVKLDESGTFHFSGARPDSPDFYRLRLDNQVINSLLTLLKQ